MNFDTDYNSYDLFGYEFINAPTTEYATRERECDEERE